MKNCEECNDETCKIRGGFDEVFKAAGHDWSSLQKRKTSLTTEVFWEEFETFYANYPTCIMVALEEALIQISMEDQSLRGAK